MKAHHQVNVIRIKEVLPHSNADKLEIVPIEGYQAVVGKGQFKPGDLAYYIPPDSVVPDRAEYAFVWGNATYDGGTPVRKRRITAKKLRGEWSEGLLMPLPDGDQEKKEWATILDVARNSYVYVQEGQDVAEHLGITHYDSEGEETNYGIASSAGGSVRPRSLKGWFFHYYNRIVALCSIDGRFRRLLKAVPTYDVDAFKKYAKTFKDGEWVEATEKIHGSNARYTFRKPWWLLFGDGRMCIGSRNLWKAYTSTCKWKKALDDNPWIEQWCRQHPGFTLYGEITPTQKGYDYGSGEKVKFFLFDVRFPGGAWMEKADYESYGLRGFTVPVLFHGGFSLEVLKGFVDGPSQVKGAQHMREGIVIVAVPERTERGVGRAQLKIVSNEFLSKETK